MKFLITIVSFFIFNHTFAEVSCSKTSTIDLSAKGGPLYPLRITDQDGLGICHAEQLHKLLKAKLSGHPDLSRVGLAINEKANRDKKILSYKKKAIRWMKSEDKVGGFYFDAGDACTAYSRLRGASICLAKDDQLEILSKKNASDQERILSALSKYFDASNDIGKVNFLLIAPFDASLEMERALNRCPIDVRISEKFRLAYEEEASESRNPKIYSTLQFNYYMNSQSMKGYVETMLPKIKRIKNFSAYFKSVYSDYLSALKDAESCATLKFHNPNESTISDFTCAAPVAPEIMSLAKFGFNLKDFYRLVQVRQDRDTYFKNAFTCEGNKVVIPSNLKCSGINTFSSALKLKDKEKHAEDFVKKVDSILEKNLPVGISVCTRFFKNPNVTTINFETSKYDCGDKDSPDYKTGEGSHAVTIIGKRCHKGNIEYLVQNSWGQGCGYYSKAYSCTGKGGFWVPAGILSMNSKALYSIQ